MEKLPERDSRGHRPPTSSSPAEVDSGRVVVVGGGIGGVSCAQEAARISPHREVVLISASDTLKDVQSVHEITETIHDLTVYERTLDAFRMDNPNIRVLRDVVTEIDPHRKVVLTGGGDTLEYSRLCLCLGARPKLIAHHPNVIGLRDLQSAEELSERLRSARHVTIVGNGGIAMELVHLLSNCDVSWIVKDGYLGNTFFDASSTAFILPTFESTGRTVRVWNEGCAPVEPSPLRHDGAATAARVGMGGSGLGPEWLRRARERSVLLESLGEGVAGSADSPQHTLDIHFYDSVRSIDDSAGGAITIHTTQGQVLSCDFLVSATGVSPVSGIEISDSDGPCDDKKAVLQLDKEGAICVDDYMRTSLSRGCVFAAGDCVTLQWSEPSRHWMQMRIWSQARAMGIYAARCMALTASPDKISAVEAKEFEFASAFAFELFTHVTRFFGHKVVLIGNFNGQGLGSDVLAAATHIIATPDSVRFSGRMPSSDQNSDHSAKSGSAEVEILLRITPGKEYIKLVVHRGRVIGAILIGETDMEEVVENLILNNIDVSRYGIDILDPDRDIEGYFD